MSASLGKALDSVDFASGFFRESFRKDGRKEECLCEAKARQPFQHKVYGCTVGQEEERGFRFPCKYLSHGR